MHNTPVLFFRSFCLLSSPCVLTTQSNTKFVSVFFSVCVDMRAWHSFSFHFDWKVIWPLLCSVFHFSLSSLSLSCSLSFLVGAWKRYICKLWGNGCSIFGTAVINGTATIIIMICPFDIGCGWRINIKIASICMMMMYPDDTDTSTLPHSDANHLKPLKE